MVGNAVETDRPITAASGKYLLAGTVPRLCRSMLEAQKFPHGDGRQPFRLLLGGALAEELQGLPSATGRAPLTTECYLA